MHHINDDGDKNCIAIQTQNIKIAIIKREGDIQIQYHVGNALQEYKRDIQKAMQDCRARFENTLPVEVSYVKGVIDLGDFRCKILSPSEKNELLPDDSDSSSTDSDDDSNANKLLNAEFYI